jgi:DNA-directed RNA polymerase specialized sigma24 family protein
LRRAEAGDDDAKGRLFIESRRLLIWSFRPYRSFLRLIAYDPEDIASDATLDVLGRMNSLAFRDVASFQRLMLTVGRYKLVSLMRKTYAEKRDIRRTTRIRFDIPSPDCPVSLAIASDLRAWVESPLSAEDREILDRRLGGDSADEIAARIGIHARTVQRRLKAIGRRITAQSSA